MTSKAGKQQSSKNSKATLSPPTGLILTKLLKNIAKREQTLELQRQFLANNEQMEPYACF